jgi:hypothetical protein
MLKALQDAAKRFPRAAMPPDALRAFAEDLDDLDPARVSAALEHLRKSEEFFPSVAKIRSAAASVMVGSADERAFRQLELALIALNDERKGGVWSQDQYLAKRAKLLECGITEERLEQAQVFKPDKSGHSPDPDLTWDRLEWRRRSYLVNPQHLGESHGPPSH